MAREDNRKGRDRDEAPEFQDRLVAINRVSKTVKGGKRFGFAALVVVGSFQIQEIRLHWLDVAIHCSHSICKFSSTTKMTIKWLYYVIKWNYVICHFCVLDTDSSFAVF